MHDNLRRKNDSREENEKGSPQQGDYHISSGEGDNRNDDPENGTNGNSHNSKKTPSENPLGLDKKQKGWQIFRQVVFWIFIFAVAVVLSQVLQAQRTQKIELTYSEFLEQLESDNIKEVTFIATRIEGEFFKAVQGKLPAAESQEFITFETRMPFEDPDLVTILDEKEVGINAKSESMNWTGIILTSLPWILFIGFWIFLMRQLQGGNKAFTFGKSKARLFTSDRPKSTFNDVAGAEEAKEELAEIIEFLKEPDKFTRLGGKIPKGALLLGPPGTGKTLLAKAVAGEAEVPFFSMSGSDFVEMFVGVGASRVRDLFEQGKKNAPCIIFIDEIDAVGRHRGAGLGGGHDEREQTLNQLLVEMDGFGTNEGVILIAATNRPDVLDPALLRPGRFDRQIVVDRPDLKGREGILKVHSRNIPLSKDTDLSVIARGTPGFSGADLASLVNEAALLAARRDSKKVSMDDFENAKDKVMMGSERRSMILTDEEKRTTAYHEAGHVLVAKMVPKADPVHKVTIIPRGRALGVTFQLPVDDRHTYSKEYLEDRIACLMGGRVAEEVIFNQFTNGASDDIRRATEIARRMVCDWGMSTKLGPLKFGDKQEQIFLGREFNQHRDYSETTAQMIDNEVRKFVDDSYQRAIEIITTHKTKLIALAEALLEKEILNNEEIDEILDREFSNQKAKAPIKRRPRPRRRPPSPPKPDESAAAAPDNKEPVKQQPKVQRKEPSIKNKPVQPKYD